MRNRYLLLLDLALVGVSAWLAVASGLPAGTDRDDLFLTFLGVAIVVKPVTFAIGGLYRRYWPYAGADDLLAVLLTNLAASTTGVVLLTLGSAAVGSPRVPPSVYAVDLILSTGLTGGLRLAALILYRARNRRLPLFAGRLDRRRRTLLLGAGEAGVMVAREVQRNQELPFLVVGYLDDDPVKQGKRIADAPVLGPISDLGRVVASHRIDEVVIAIPSAPGTLIRQFVTDCRRLSVPSKTLPALSELLDNRVSIRRLRDVQISDLLRRRQVRPQFENLTYCKDRVVLVTGAGGSIGSELCRQVAQVAPRELIVLGHGENSIYAVLGALRQSFPDVSVVPVIADIRDGRRLRQLFDQHRPAVVFHAAAHKHVPLMEMNIPEAITNNVLGTAHVLDAAVAAGTDRFVLISSDKAVAPTSVMGGTKRLAEQLVRLTARKHGRAFVTVRFGNVLGSRGSVVPLFKEQIERGGPITITDPDMRRYFMMIPEAVQLVLQAGGLGHGGEVFVLEMGELVPVLSIAHDLIRLSGLDPDDVPIVFTGRRPGEKLVEQLWDDAAQIEGTTHPDVLRVLEPEIAATIPVLEATMDQIGGVDWAPESLVAGLVEACQQLVAGTASVN